MKIMLCGKGGCGKSTISALMAKEYERRGRRVLVVDMDESNFGLYRQLGTELPKDLTLFFGSKKGVFNSIDTQGYAFEEMTVDQLPEDYVSVNGNITLAAVGKIHDAGEGCACPMGAVAREFIAAIRQEEGDVLIADTEAGVEHFGRGVDAKADIILMVADPSYESIQLAGKVGHMAEQMGKPVYYILNKVNPQKEEVLRKAIQGEVIGAVPEDEEIQMQGMLGMPLDARLEVIGRICDFLEREV